MADVFSKAKRSDVMSRIRSRGNAQTELALVSLLKAHGITGWRRHFKLKVQGSKKTVRPDFVFPRERVVVFVDGCFWHGCPLHGTRPKGNAAFWRRKIEGNMARDRRVHRALRRSGWSVLRLWEHALRRTAMKRGATEAVPVVIRRILRALRS
jgi:DNA mismatch endonuclease, patch repair protein